MEALRDGVVLTFVAALRVGLLFIVFVATREVVRASGWRPYAKGGALAAAFSLLLAAQLGTHTERTGGPPDNFEVVVDFRPTVKQRIELGAPLFGGLMTTIAIGILDARSLRRKEARLIDTLTRASNFE